MILTPRDREIFKHLSNYGMLATKHIKKLFFSGIATTTVLRRLRILEDEKFIRRLHGLESKEALWIMTDKAAQLTGVVQFKRLWNKNLLVHDFKLLELRLVFESLGIAKSWIPEHEIRHLIFKKYAVKEAKMKLVPDGIMITKTQAKEVSVAIELELNLKSKERIKEIVHRYRDKKDITYLWYICQTDSIAKSIGENWKRYTSSLTPIKLCTSILEDVMKNPLDARVFNESGSIALRELWPPPTTAQDAHIHAQDVSTLQTPRTITPDGSSAKNCTVFPYSNAPPDSCLHY